MNTFTSKTKLLATITIMLLFASAMLAVVPSANAISTLSIDVDSGVTGTKVLVSGNAQNPGATVTIYWDTLDGTVLNTTRASSSSVSGVLFGHFECYVTIPEGKKGDHYILAAESVSSGSGSNAATVSEIFTIEPQITLTPNRGMSGDTVTITGTGWTPSSSGALNAVVFSFSNGTTWEVDPLTVSQSPVRPNANGSFAVTFTVPYDAPTNPRAPLTDSSTGNIYTVTAKDTAGPDTESAPFVVGPTITLTPTSGRVGTVIAITGRGFTPNAVILNTTTGGLYNGLTFNGVPAIVLTSGSIVVGASGTFTASILVQSILNGTYDVKAIEQSTGREGLARFRVNGQPRISTNSPSGTPTTSYANGDTITVTGGNFSALGGTNVTLTLTGKTGTATAGYSHNLQSTTGAGVATTGTDGTFTFSFVVPATPTGVYNLKATDAYGIESTIDFTVAITAVSISPALSGYVTGQTINIKGIGFNEYSTSYTANITVGGQRVATNVGDTVVTSTGRDWVINNLSPGTYTVEIVNTDGLSGRTNITITQGSTVTANPSPACRDSNLNITGVYFSNNAWATIRILNATTRAEVNSISAATNSTGGFNATFHIPATYNLGDYIINVTDTNGLTAEIPLSVVKVSINIAVGASSYTQGDIGTFQLTSNTAPTGTITIYDSSGAIVVPITLSSANWVQSGSGNFVYTQITDGGVSAGALFRIASDARVGTWNWNSTINDANEPQTYKGTFTVNSRTATATPPASTAPASTPPASTPPASTPPASTAPASTPPATATPTPTPEDTRDWTKVIIIIAVIALIVGVIAVFLFVTMRRKIAN